MNRKTVQIDLESYEYLRQLAYHTRLSIRELAAQAIKQHHEQLTEQGKLK